MNIIADKSKLNKDDLALLVIRKIEELKLENAVIYYNFPFYRGETMQDLIQAHVLLVSKEYGIICFRCLEKETSFTESEKIKLDDLDSHIFAKVNKHEEFRINRRELKIDISPYVFVNAELETDSADFIDITEIKDVIEENKKQELTEGEYELLVAIIEGTTNIKLKKDRIEENPDVVTKGKVLNILQNKQAVFDIYQKKAALNILDTPQRIRGLAGSGKTIILAMKAALYHLQNPDAEILYTYFTKALYGQVKYLIEKYYRDFSDNNQPDWKKIHIWHGWGGRGLRGVYSDTCFENNIPTISFSAAKVASPKDPFGYACGELNKQPLKPKFDLTLIDEGQDFPQHFYRICRKITKDNRLVWAYDDFQNILDIDIQDEKETFGKDEAGNYYVDFSKQENELQDIILYKCYRNPRIALLNAFSLGLGIYNDKVLQRLENNKHWEDLGFIVEKGESKDYEEMVISRPEENSPVETNNYFKSDSVTINLFKTLEEECSFVAKQIIDDIRLQGLRADDICVIGLDAGNIQVYLDEIQKRLENNGVKVFNLIDAPNNNTFFSQENHVTLSTIYKAKGNEAGMVYIVGVDAVFQQDNKDFTVDRNKLFTAMTRSKGWVAMTGFERAALCAKEMQILKDNNYKLIFKQPSKDDTKTIFRGINAQQSFLNEINKRIEHFANTTGLSTEEIRKLLINQSKDKK